MYLQIIPRIMPAIMGDARIKEKFQDEDYVIQVEQMFREKFLENLGVSLNTLGAIAKLQGVPIEKCQK